MKVGRGRVVFPVMKQDLESVIFGNAGNKFRSNLLHMLCAKQW